MAFSERAKDLDLFDINCMVGPTNTNREPAFKDAVELLAEMDRLGIAEALVYSSLARYAHPNDGNAHLMEMIRGEARLHPAWVLLPPGTGEIPAPSELVQQMRERGVRAARIFPRDHRYPFLERTFRPLLEALAEAKVPLLIDSSRSGWADIAVDWRELLEISSRYPDLPLVLLREGGTTWRVLFGVWQEHPNIYLDTSYFQESRITAEISDRFGADRLLFGTAMPQFDPGGPLASLLGTPLSARQRTAIAGDNARRLLGLHVRSNVESLDDEKPKPDAIWPCGPSGFRVFDVHGHIGRWEHRYYADWAAEHMVQYMDQLGIERFCVSDVQAIGPDYRRGNDRIGAAVKQFPNRLVGYGVYNPNYGDQMADEMRRCFDELSCRGIKLHCALHDTATTDQSYRLAFQTAHERACPILCHVHENPSPEFFKSILADYPRCKFIYAHVGGGGKADLKPLLDVARERPNFFVELSLSNIPRGGLKWLAGEIPIEQILYGSDHPLNDFTFQLGRVFYADIDDSSKQKILWDNAARIFNIS